MADSSTPRYRVVGPCKVHGAAKGEIVPVSLSPHRAAHLISAGHIEEVPVLKKPRKRHTPKVAAPEVVPEVSADEPNAANSKVSLVKEWIFSPRKELTDG